MRPLKLALAAVFFSAATLAHAAGVRFIDIAAGATGPAMTGAVWYPCAAPPQDINISDRDIGDRTLAGAKDCPLTGDKLPLIVVSHGRTGWFGGHHDTAAAMADAGFVVAAISHPGDNASDQSRLDSLSVLIERPADIKRLIDFMLDAWPDASRIDAERIGLYGFSMGGYTGLVVIGANPDLRKGLARCEGSSFRACQQLENNELPGEALTHDPRVKAAVIVDPAPSFLFPADNLKAVTVPVQLWSSDSSLGADHLSGCCAIGINERLPSKPDYHFAKNAKHLSFLALCSPEETRAFPRICTDAPGFDRVAFHQQFHAEMIAFFRKHLGDGHGQ
jgi:predicted dienelactone hydrolase